MKKNKVSFNKIPIEGLIQVLDKLYELGADFIDIQGFDGQTFDVLDIVVRPEYMSEGEEDVELNDENLDSLI